jgi:hypothetical protein
MVNEAVNPHTIFTAEDRVGFLLDTFAFAKAGQTKTSSLLALIDALRSDHDCQCISSRWTIALAEAGVLVSDFVLNAVASSLTSMRLLWRDHANIVVGLKLLQQVCVEYHAMTITGLSIEHLRSSRGTPRVRCPTRRNAARRSASLNRCRTSCVWRRAQVRESLASQPCIVY